MRTFTFLYWISQKSLKSQFLNTLQKKKEKKGKSDPVTFESLTGVGR